MAHAEVLLMAIVIGLYLYDSTLLLFCNEGILIPKGKEDWGICFGLRNFRIKGKEIFIPNLFLPCRPVFRLSWQFEGNAAQATGDWSQGRNAFASLVPMVWGMATALFLLFPLGLFTRLGEPIMLVAIFLLYISIIAALVWLWLNRAKFDMLGMRFTGLAVESLICAPFALNLIRKLSTTISVSEDLVHAARRLQRPVDWNTTRIELVARIVEEIESEDEESDRFAALNAHRSRLMNQEASCPPRKSL